VLSCASIVDVYQQNFALLYWLVYINMAMHLLSFTSYHNGLPQPVVLKGIPRNNAMCFLNA